MTPDTLHTFWAAGDLRCVLVRHAVGVQKYMVQVVRGPDVVCSAFIGEPVEVEGRAAADRLKGIFVDRARW